VIVFLGYAVVQLPLGVAAKQDKARAFARIGERQGAPNAA